MSSAQNAEEASAIAAQTACDLLQEAVQQKADDLEAAMSAAIGAAHQAVCALPYLEGDSERSACRDHRRGGRARTARRPSAGWGTVAPTGLARAQGMQLTRDHSWVNEVVDAGEMTEAQALASPLAHAITRCLGVMEGESPATAPEIGLMKSRLDGPGMLLLCTDGLWNYAPETEQIGALLHEGTQTEESVACGAPSGRLRESTGRARQHHGGDLSGLNIVLMLMGRDAMQFRVESFLNSYLPAGTRRVDAILTVTADAGDGAAAAARTRAVVGLIIDISGSMQGERINAVKHATRKVIELLDEEHLLLRHRLFGPRGQRLCAGAGDAAEQNARRCAGAAGRGGRRHAHVDRPDGGARGVSEDAGARCTTRSFSPTARTTTMTSCR